MRRARVIGAGLSGLTAAWALARRGIAVEVIEAGPSPGGLIHTTTRPEGLVESGANAFVWTPAVADLFTSLELEPLFARDASRRRFVFREGRARRWPLTPRETAATAARVGAMWAVRRTAALPGESIAAWGTRVAGRAATEWLLAPALQGIYGAPAAELSAQVIRAGRRRGRIRQAAPREGMGALIDRLHHRLLRAGAVVTLDHAVTSLEPGEPAIVCTSAPAAAPLLAPHHPALAAAAARIRTAPLVSATAFFDPDPADLRGFGVLFPRGTARALGVLFNADIFEHRGALRSERWIFGDRSLATAAVADVAAAIERDRFVLTGRRDPMIAIDMRSWTAALPVYDDAVAEAAKASTTLPPWLGVCGNYLGRIGVSALVERAEAEAARLAARLSGRRPAASAASPASS